MPLARSFLRSFVRMALGVACGLAVTPTPALAAPAPTPAPAPAPAEAVHLVGGELHVGDGTVIKDAVIAMANGRFTVVGGPEARAKLPAGAVPVDLAGQIVTPGLFASDTQLGLLEIDMEASTRDDVMNHDHPVRASHAAHAALNADSALIPIQVVDGITTAAVAPRGGLISGQIAVIDLVAGAHRTLVAKPSAGIFASLGHAYAGSRAATLAKLREVLSDARGYPARRAAYDRAQSRPLAAHPLDLEALQPLFRREAVLTLAADRASDILAAIDLATEFKLRVAIVGGSEAWKVADELARAQIPVIVEPTQNLPTSFDSMGARLDNAALLHRAGVTVVLASPGGTHNLRNLTQGAGIAVANGLPWAAALTAITLAPARAYGVDASHGSVAVGKVANLVVWDGDPFEFSSAAKTVYVRGVAVSKRSRQTLLRDRYRDLKQFTPKDK